VKRAFRLSLWALNPVFLYFGLAIFGALVPASLIAPSGPNYGPNSSQTSAGQEIVLVAGPIHYDILLPADNDTRAAVAFIETAGVPIGSRGVQWLSVGWGSEAFYTTTGSFRNLSLRTIWRAAMGDAGVIRFEVYGALPDHPSLRRVKVSQAQLDALRAAIRGDLGVEPNALSLDGFSMMDAFYSAAGRFHVLSTCNVWVGQKLADVGLALGIWTPTPYAVTLSLWWNGHLDG
jgi:uncharacterized protein (TIGR02117 family)